MSYKFNPFTGKLDEVNPAVDLSTRATVELDNLGTVAINTSLISDTDSTDDLGSSSVFWANVYTDKLFLSTTAFLEPDSVFSQVLSVSNGLFIKGTFGLRIYRNDNFWQEGLAVSNDLTIKYNNDLKWTFGIVQNTTRYGINPTFDSSVDLGSSTKFWRKLYVDELIGPTVFNEAGANVDFRFEGDNSANLLTLDAGNDNITINAAAVSANYDLMLAGDGVLGLKETTTPTADADHGKVYTKTDNKIYFQDGAGAEHEIAFV